MQTTRYLKCVPTVLAIVCCFAALTACQDPPPIKIGFAGGLTGRHSDLGVYGRNGVLLAVEEANSKGGINGRAIELLVMDDQQDPAIAATVDNQLIDAGVVAIIGHFTSAMSVAAAPITNSRKVLLFSPTTSTNQLSGHDDHFIRVMSPSRYTTEKLATHVFDRLNLRRLVIVYDDKNQAFADDWLDGFRQFATSRNATVTPVAFTPHPDYPFSSLPDSINAQSPDGLLIIAAALDAAMICQQVRKEGSTYPIFTTMWSMSDEFIQHGGSAVEGVTFANWFDPDHPSESSRRFRDTFSRRFGHPPTFAAHFAYETAIILIDGLRRNDNPLELKDTILLQKIYDGTQGTIEFDRYGDPVRDLFLMTVRNGRFVRLESGK